MTGHPRAGDSMKNYFDLYVTGTIHNNEMVVTLGYLNNSNKIINTVDTTTKKHLCYCRDIYQRLCNEMNSKINT